MSSIVRRVILGLPGAISLNQSCVTDVFSGSSASKSVTSQGITNIFTSFPVKTKKAEDICAVDSR